MDRASAPWPEQWAMWDCRAGRAGAARRAVPGWRWRGADLSGRGDRGARVGARRDRDAVCRARRLEDGARHDRDRRSRCRLRSASAGPSTASMASAAFSSCARTPARSRARTHGRANAPCATRSRGPSRFAVTDRRVPPGERSSDGHAQAAQAARRLTSAGAPGAVRRRRRSAWLLAAGLGGARRLPAAQGQHEEADADEWVTARRVALDRRPSAFFSVSLSAAEDSEEALGATQDCVVDFCEETG